MNKHWIKLSSFSFGAEGTGASEYTLPDANLTAMLEMNMGGPEIAQLSGVQVPADAEGNLKKALGVESGQLLPATYEWVAIKFTLVSGATFWFPKCKRYTAVSRVTFTAYDYQQPNEDKWFAEINGVRTNSDRPVRFELADQDKDQGLNKI